MMTEEDVDLHVSKSNIEGIGPVATKVCIVLVSKCLNDIFVSHEVLRHDPHH